jgi:hypothetical protein
MTRPAAGRRSWVRPLIRGHSRGLTLISRDKWIACQVTRKADTNQYRLPISFERRWNDTSKATTFD